MSYESVHNYYERAVIEYLRERMEAGCTSDKLADIACVTLNHLPPRYIRHDVDMSFYLSPQEQLEMNDKVRKAADDAIKLVEAKSQSK